MIGRSSLVIQETGAVLVTVLLLSSGCIFQHRTPQAAAPPVAAPAPGPLSSPQITETLPPPQPIPAGAVPPEIGAPVAASLPSPEIPPAPPPRPVRRNVRPTTVPPPAAAAVAPPARNEGNPSVATAASPQLRPMLTAAQERQLQQSINRSLANAEQLLARLGNVQSDRERAASVALVRSFIEQAQQARRKGDLNGARSLAERAELMAADLSQGAK
ncbi:MAG TPA: hypothetical protein VFA54_09810 [Bryobacterales bacterium]|jgi:hypothetical protein|nr:hypothetical protein [Bryobacterales bacterium]